MNSIRPNSTVNHEADEESESDDTDNENDERENNENNIFMKLSLIHI